MKGDDVMTLFDQDGSNLENHVTSGGALDDLETIRISALTGLRTATAEAVSCGSSVLLAQRHPPAPEAPHLVLGRLPPRPQPTPQSLALRADSRAQPV